MKKKAEAIDGVFLLDKGYGVSSNYALQKVRRSINAKKAGHTGTLDPMATGLLPLCFGNATKFSADLLHADKGYEARVRLGITTTTGDREGRVVSQVDVNVTEEALRAVAAKFLGRIEQVPPMYSALKRNGEALYEIARRGRTVEREPRRVTIHALRIRDFDGQRFTMSCLVSKGTYIRVLGEDIGKALGVGAHLTALRRTRVGDLTIENAVTRQALDEALEQGLEAARALLAPVDFLLRSLEAIHLDSRQTTRFMHGQRLVLAAGTVQREGLVRVYGADGRFLGTAQWEASGRLSPQRLMS